MQKTALLIFAVAALASASVSGASARFRGENIDVTDVGGGTCQVVGQAFKLIGGTYSRSMTVVSGSECGGTFGAVGVVVFEHLYLAAPPQHGTVALRQGGHYHYTAAKGYRGADNFTLRVCGGRQGAAEHCSDLQFAVTVQ